ncbi:hypothetical protein DLE60_08080 [Micromonospora globispora]|uniref:Uncharacterized protein n=1 Tax=Micromonospora globispora TaxID=1450148 RepID=A0A317K977_9ACTN|nr:hypothetical protein [Micromonospora globispora]PWU47713.1 hypothetical protein DLJ46_13925 [Micromonospora globispora]PWU60968.1 hypothetical protein DLE60_08080 [Micromonospora globispora]RQW82860.1 hypothetical protein DKL51_32645 [Micromonospora globispora]
MEAVTGSPVYRLPAGETVAGVYRSDDRRFDLMAENLTGFLNRLRELVETFAATGSAEDL